MNRPYILRWEGGSPSIEAEIELIGPFKSSPQAADWATEKINNPDDDPRWQVVWMPQLAAIATLIKTREP